MEAAATLEEACRLGPTPGVRNVMHPTRRSGAGTALSQVHLERTILRGIQKVAGSSPHVGFPYFPNDLAGFVQRLDHLGRLAPPHGNVL